MFEPSIFPVPAYRRAQALFQGGVFQAQFLLRPRAVDAETVGDESEGLPGKYGRAFGQTGDPFAQQSIGTGERGGGAGAPYLLLRARRRCPRLGARGAGRKAGEPREVTAEGFSPRPTS